MGMMLDFSPFFTLTIILVGLLQLFSSWSSSTTVNAWTVPLPGGRKVSYRDGILRIQVEDEATLPSIPGFVGNNTTPLSQVAMNGSIELRDTKTIKGWGAFCVSSPIDRHTFLGFYEGIKTTQLLSTPRTNDDDNNNNKNDTNRMGYMLSLDGGTSYLDGYERAQDRTTFSPVHLNHADKTSPQCNCMRLLSDDGQHVAFFTSRAIQVGEELCFDYGTNYWIGREHEKIP